jgi:ABC-2 type transport system ATP-binding protein
LEAILSKITQKKLLKKYINRSKNKTMNNALELKNISKKYGNYQALDDINFTVPKGSIFGILGPNGAGKTTMLRIITGIFLQDSGEVRLDGKLANGLSNSASIGYMPEERGLYKKMKVEEQAIYLAQLKGMAYSEAKEKVNTWFQKLGMEDWKHKKMEELSKGMGQKLQFVCTVVHNPSLIILDEPFTGLDPLNADLIKDEIFNLAKQGSTILFSTHRMEQVDEICNQIVLINKGKIILNNNVKDARKSYQNNQFIIETEAISAFENSNFFKIIKSKNQTVTLQLHDTKTIHDILSFIVSNKIQIQSIRENLPTLHEIFIQLVKEDNI